MTVVPDFSYLGVSQKPADPLRPIVTLTPIEGFPSNVTLPSDDNTGDVTLGLEDRLQHFQIIDHDKHLDKCEITFIDEEGLFTDPNRLLHGAVIDIAWGYPGLMSQKRRLIVRRIKLGLMQGRKFARRRRGFLVTFTALAPGIISHNKEPDTNDVYEGVPLSSVVLQITQKMGFSQEGTGQYRCVINVPSSVDVVRDSITRVGPETYEQFLMRLAEENGLLYRKDAQHGVYFGPRLTEDKAALIVDQDGDTLMGFELDGDLIFGVPAGLTVVGLHPADQKLTKTTLQQGTTKKGNTQPIAHTEADAQTSTAPDTTSGQVESVDSFAVIGTKSISALSALAKTHTVMEDYRPSVSDKVASKLARYYNERIKKTWKLRLKLIGTIKAIAGSTILLQNFETALLEGLWYVIEVRHTIDQGGYVTELTCRRETSRNASAGSSQLTDTNLQSATGTGKKETTVVQSFALVGAAPLATNKTTRRNNHSTDGDFFTTTTRSNK